MTNHPQKKVGLQKKVSSVFEGAPTPQRDDNEQPAPKLTSDDPSHVPSEPIHRNSLVSKSSLMKKVYRPESSSDKTVINPTNMVLSEGITLASQDIPIPKPHQAEDEPDKATPGRTVDIPPERPDLDHMIPHCSPAKKPKKTWYSSNGATPDRSSSIPSWMKNPEHVDIRNSFMNESKHSEDSSIQKESDLTDQVSQIVQNESNPQPFSMEEPQQAKNDSDKVAQSRKSWVPPKLTTPDRPISKASSTTKPEQVERRDKTEPGRTNVDDPQKHAAAKGLASQSSITKNLHQTESTPRTSAPDRRVDTSSTSKPANHQSPQNSEFTKRYGPGAPPKEAASSRQPKTTVSAEVSGPSLWQKINKRLFAPKPGVSPARQKVMVISIPILAIVLIFAFRQVLSKSPNKTKGANAEDVALAVKADSSHEIDWQIPEQLPATMRDPTNLPFQSNTQTEEPKQTDIIPKTKLIHLGAIVYSRNKSSAVVNGRITHVGDVVSGITILRINRDSVEFEKDGEKWVQKVRD